MFYFAADWVGKGHDFTLQTSSHRQRIFCFPERANISISCSAWSLTCFDNGGWIYWKVIFLRCFVILQPYWRLFSFYIKVVKKPAVTKKNICTRSKMSCKVDKRFFFVNLASTFLMPKTSLKLAMSWELTRLSCWRGSSQREHDTALAIQFHLTF